MVRIQSFSISILDFLTIRTYFKILRFSKSYRFLRSASLRRYQTPKSRLYCGFTSNIQPFFWLRVSWTLWTKQLPLYNDLFVNTYYKKKLKNYFLLENRFSFHNVQRLSSVLPQSHVAYTRRLSVLYYFLNSYRSLFYQFLAENFFVYKRLKKSSSSVLFRLFFFFRATKLFVTMQNAKCQNLFFLSLGFFLKYFEKRKVLKKSKAFKLFLAKTLRKIFLLSNLTKFYFFIRGTPIYFVDMLRLINKRIDHPFFNPYEKTIFDESPASKKLTVIQIPYFFFIRNTSFVPIKTRKRGRIKRKLRRRLVAKNRQSD